MLDERDMLPALYFIFSRMGCEEAVAACLDAGLRLTTPDERARIRAIVEERTAALTDDDLDVLGLRPVVERALEMGLAAHHAGMVPPFKEAVEACFVEGLVKAVFATETLALGVNMPARSVVIERLTKFTGEARAFLTPGEYTQLTGRAGRRGIDDLGYAIVLWSPFVPFDQVASLASSRTYGLRSAFRPTYNMAANLVRRYEPAEAHHLLNLSFAQFQADRAVVRFEARIERQQERLARLEPTRPAASGATWGSTGALVQAEHAAARPHPPCAGRSSSPCPGSCPATWSSMGGQRLAVLSVAYRKGGDLRLQGHRRRRRAGHPRRRRHVACRPSASAGSTCPGLTSRTTGPSSTRWRTSCARPASPGARPGATADATATATTAAVRPPGRRSRPTRSHGCPDRERHVRAHAQMERAAARAGGHAARGAVPHRLAGPAASTGCCGCSRRGATSTGGR